MDLFKRAGDRAGFGVAAPREGDDARGVGQTVDRDQRVAPRRLQGRSQLLPGSHLPEGVPAGGRWHLHRVPGTVFGPAALSMRTWTHLAVTYDGSRLRFYVNGVRVATVRKSGTLASSSAPLKIGGLGARGRYFRGLIDEVRVYNVARSQGQIRTDMATPVRAALPDQQPPTRPGSLHERRCQRPDRAQLGAGHGQPRRHRLPTRTLRGRGLQRLRVADRHDRAPVTPTPRSAAATATATASAPSTPPATWAPTPTPPPPLPRHRRTRLRRPGSLTATAVRQ